MSKRLSFLLFMFAFTSISKVLSFPFGRSIQRNKLFIVPLIISTTFYMSAAANAAEEVIDSLYPGTAVQRMLSARQRVKSLTPEQLNNNWDSVRRNILWAGGLKDLPNASPGQGYTGHSFNDFNHCDLTTMLDDVSHSENEGRVAGIAHRNPLGAGIRIASMEELGPGGSWSTCMLGCQYEPPHDVAHIQFRSRIAFKLVWVPPMFASFVLVDDDGGLLAQGTPTGKLPRESERAQNYQVVRGSKYAAAADEIAVVATFSNASCNQSKDVSAV